MMRYFDSNTVLACCWPLPGEFPSLSN
uniref:Uncharacterized protein n=1 Tax=Arundo donax TaxID=35708 RepID=A0A0A9ALN9_ARUDO